jgi:hypothetical protein
MEFVCLWNTRMQKVELIHSAVDQCTQFLRYQIESLILHIHGKSVTYATEFFKDEFALSIAFASA